MALLASQVFICEALSTGPVVTAKLNKFNTGVDSRAMFKAMADEFKYKGSSWWTNSSSTARATLETVFSKFKCKIGNSKAMFKAMVNQSNCKEENSWRTGTSARTRP